MAQNKGDAKDKPITFNVVDREGELEGWAQLDDALVVVDHSHRRLRRRRADKTIT
jgi:uncharacterized protein GlcG (DUF336 family)